MALSIKDDEVDRRVRQLAAERGTSLTGAIRLAVDNELARVARVAVDKEELLRITRSIQARYRALPPDPAVAHLTADEILGYDASGLPG